MRRSLASLIFPIAALSMAGFAPLPARAQIDPHVLPRDVANENLFFSIKAGVNAADISNIDGETRWGFNLGLMVTIKLAPQLYLVPELSPLSPKGVKRIPTATSGNGGLDMLISNDRSRTLELNYIDIPVILTYTPAEQFAVGVGPYFAFLTGATEVFESFIDGNELSIRDGVKDEFNKGDIGLAFDVRYTVGRAHRGRGVNVHLRFQRGFVDLRKGNNEDAVKNTVFQIYASLPFIRADKHEN